jgi:hypothetical protein
VAVDYAFAPPNGNTRPLFPAVNATIDTGRPTVVSVNSCTNCNCREASIESLTDNAVDLSWDPSYILGRRPNVVEFDSFFGMDADGNQGSAGDIRASGLPQGEDYALFTTVGICAASTEASCGGGNQSCDYYSGEFEIDIRLFSVSTTTATTADLNEVEIGIQELGSKGATTEISEEVGFYATADLEGNNFSVANLYVPNQAAAKSFTFDGIDEFEWVSAVQASHADALAIFPPTDGESKYVLMVDNGRAAAALDFVPVQPNGMMTFTELVDGDSISPTPTFNLVNSCTNCSLGVVWLEDILTGGDVLDSEAYAVQPAAGPITFVAPDDFDHSGPLAAEDYLVGSEALDETVFIEGQLAAPLLVATAGEDGFDYFALDSTTDIIRVTVPEPTLFAMAVASLACVVGLARRRRLG